MFRPFVVLLKVAWLLKMSVEHWCNDTDRENPKTKINARYM